jgi:hypothetical protein
VAKHVSLVGGRAGQVDVEWSSPRHPAWRLVREGRGTSSLRCDLCSPVYGYGARSFRLRLAVTLPVRQTVPRGVTPMTEEKARNAPTWSTLLCGGMRRPRVSASPSPRNRSRRERNFPGDRHV